MELLTTGDNPPKANWKRIKTALIHSAPGRLKAAPYQIKSVAIRDACKAVSSMKKRNKGLSADSPGFSRVHFRSRKFKQNAFIPAKAVSPTGAYHTLLGELKTAEPIPGNPCDSRLVYERGEFHLCVPHEERRPVSETQARAAALDPGIRSFLTWFSETDAGHIAKGDFGRLQRLCARLDGLLSRAKQAGHQRRRNMYQAADRARTRIRNLVDELHHKAAKYLTDNFDIILLPSFETSEMVLRGQRKLRRKSVRNLLTFAHYRFQQFLAWKCKQTGKALFIVNEAYTSKTCSWSGEIISNLGGRRVVTGSDGISMERDQNGARGIFLRALGDTPLLQFGLGRCNTPQGGVSSALTSAEGVDGRVSVC